MPALCPSTMTYPCTSRPDSLPGPALAISSSLVSTRRPPSSEGEAPRRQDRRQGGNHSSASAAPVVSSRSPPPRRRGKLTPWANRNTTDMLIAKNRVAGAQGRGNSSIPFGAMGPPWPGRKNKFLDLQTAPTRRAALTTWGNNHTYSLYFDGGCRESQTGWVPCG